MMRTSPGPPGAMRSSLPNFANINNIHQCEIHMKPRKRQNFLQVCALVNQITLIRLTTKILRRILAFPGKIYSPSHYSRFYNKPLPSTRGSKNTSPFNFLKSKYRVSQKMFISKKDEQLTNEHFFWDTW